MDVKIFPSKLDGVIEAVSNKAHAQRVFLASILSKEKTDIYLKTPFQEIKDTLSIIKSLGGLAVQNDFDYTVSPAKTLPTVAEFSCGDQISTIKFIAPVLSALKVNQRIELSEKLRKKIDVSDFYCLRGVEPCKRGGYLTFTGKLASGEYRASEIKGSQLLSSLIMSLAVIDGDSKIICDNSIKNKIYFKQTLAVMRDFGVEVELCDDGVNIKGNQTYSPKTQITVEGDYTASSFLLGANLLGADIEIMGLNEDSVQTDKNIETHLSSFSKKGTVFNLSSSPDLAYPLTAVACFSPSNTTIKGINFSGKEGECFSALITALNKLGASIKLENEEVIIEGKKTLKGGAMVDSFGDSRIALALSIASSFAQEPTTILSAHAVNKLYPNFYNDFKTLGGTCQAF